MPKGPKLVINIDLLKPQSSPEKIWITFTRWLFSAGRYILVFVELIVLAAFLARFQFDAQLASLKEAIEEQIPYVESLRPYEVLVKQLQLKISTIKDINQTSADYSTILKKIADQTPQGLKISNLTLEKNIGKIVIQMTGEARSNSDLSTFVAGLREDKSFIDVGLTGVGLEEGLIRFSVAASANIPSQGEKSL